MDPADGTPWKLQAAIDPQGIPHASVRGLWETFEWIPHTQTCEWFSALPASRRLFATTSDSRQRALATSCIDLTISRRRARIEGRIDRGPVAASLAALEHHIEQLTTLLSKRVNALTISPTVRGLGAADLAAWSEARGYRVESAPRLYRHTLTVPLEMGPDALRAGFRRSVRWNLNRHERLGLSVTPVSSAREAADFFDRFRRFARARHIAAPSPEFIERLWSALSQPAGTLECLVLASRQGQTTLGGAAYLRAGNRAVYTWGYAEPDASRDLPILHGCMWAAMNHFRERGVRTLDLGGLWAERGNDDPINFFKLGFSKNMEQLPSEVHVPLGARTNAWAAVSGRALTAAWLREHLP